MPGVNRTDKERKIILEKIDPAYNSSDLTIKEACSKIGISDATYYSWKNRLNYNSSENSNSEKNNLVLILQKLKKKSFP